MMVKLVAYLVLILAVVGGVSAVNVSETQNLEPKAEVVSKITELIKSFKDANDGTVLIAAHRGDHLHFPENSIAAMLSAVSLGADIVEVDVRKTKDGVLVLVHDSTIDRTTNGLGSVSKLSFEEDIQRFYLKWPDGRVSRYKVPTLKEAMTALRGKCLIMLDKSNDYFDQCLEMAKAMGMANQMIFKSSKSIDEMKPILKNNPDIFYCVGINAKNKNHIDSYKQGIEQLKPQLLEISYTEETSWLISEQARKLADKYDVRIWNNSLDKPRCSAGRTDSKALRDPNENWGWQIKHGVDIIQTDEIVALKAYLCSIGRHK